MIKYVVAIRKGYERARFEFDSKVEALEFLETISERYVEDVNTVSTEGTEFLFFKKKEKSESGEVKNADNRET
jgi:hypothetical protein